MSTHQVPDTVDTVVIGAGQSGLAAGHHLARLGVEFVILDANDRVGAVWRNRWNSPRLFTPSQYSSLSDGDGSKPDRLVTRSCGSWPTGSSTCATRSDDGSATTSSTLCVASREDG